MNKKLYGSIAVVAVLLGYIFFSNQKGTRDVPELKSWEGDITGLSIQADEKSLVFSRVDGKSVVGEQKYPADEEKIKNLVNKVRDLKLTDLISRQKFYQNYDLTPDKAAVILLKQKDRVVRKLTVGKTGSTGRHSYLLVDNRPEVYQGAVSFSSETKSTLDDFRDRVIMKVSKDAVSSFAVKYRGRTFAFNREEVKPEKKEAPKPGLKKAPPASSTQPVVKWTCKGFERVTLNRGRVEGLLASLNPLRASSFPPLEKKRLGPPLAAVTLKAFNRDIDVKIFRQQKDKKYLALSSESPYVFTIDEWRAKKYFIENLKDLKDNK